MDNCVKSFQKKSGFCENLYWNHSFEQNLDQNPLIFDRISLENHKIAYFDDLDRPNRSKTIKNRKIHPGELSEFFPFFFAKFYFSHFFQVFSSAPWRNFRHFARSPMQSTLLKLFLQSTRHARWYFKHCLSCDFDYKS